MFSYELQLIPELRFCLVSYSRSVTDCCCLCTSFIFEVLVLKKQQLGVNYADDSSPLVTGSYRPVNYTGSPENDMQMIKNEPMKDTSLSHSQDDSSLLVIGS